MRTTNRTAGDESIRAIDDRNAYIMQSLLHGVATRGTAARASRMLKRGDIGGKTGTTNNSHDAWFCGYAGGLVAVSWMGYDNPKPLGARETGGGLALPVWIDFMKAERDGEVFYRDPVKGAAGAFSDLLMSGRDEASELVRDQIF